MVNEKLMQLKIKLISNKKHCRLNKETENSSEIHKKTLLIIMRNFFDTEYIKKIYCVKKRWLLS